MVFDAVVVVSAGDGVAGSLPIPDEHPVPTAKATIMTAAASTACRECLPMPVNLGNASHADRRTRALRLTVNLAAGPTNHSLNSGFHPRWYGFVRRRTSATCLRARLAAVTTGDVRICRRDCCA